MSDSLRMVSALVLCSALVTLWSETPVASHRGNAALAPASGLAAQWGVTVQSIRQTAAGFAVDFRYRVVDADKAAGLFKRSNKAYLLDHTSGRAMPVASGPTTGPMRSVNAPVAGKTYAILFTNPGRLVRVGSSVSVSIGGFKAEDLVVQ